MGEENNLRNDEPEDFIPSNAYKEIIRPICDRKKLNKHDKNALENKATHMRNKKEKNRKRSKLAKLSRKKNRR